MREEPRWCWGQAHAGGPIASESRRTSVKAGVLSSSDARLRLRFGVKHDARLPWALTSGRRPGFIGLIYPAITEVGLPTQNSEGPIFEDKLVVAPPIGVIKTAKDVTLYVADSQYSGALGNIDGFLKFSDGTIEIRLIIKDKYNVLYEYYGNGIFKIKSK